MLNITTRDKAGVMIIDLEGQIDGGPLSAKVHELIKQNLDKGQKKFVLNLTERQMAELPRSRDPDRRLRFGEASGTPRSSSSA